VVSKGCRGECEGKVELGPSENEGGIMLAPTFRCARFKPLALTLVLLCSHSLAAQEVLYLTNTSVVDDNDEPITELYYVEIDEGAGTAAPVLIGTLDLDQVDAMGCSPDDTVCFLIDKYDPVVRPDGGQFGAFEMLTGEFTLLGEVVDLHGDRIPGIVLAGHSPGPDGELYIASQDTHYVYTLDIVSGIATPVGMVVAGDPPTVVDLEGADLTFASNGDMFVWANWENTVNAPAGLYSAVLPESTGNIQATYLGTGIDGADPQSHFFTGVAIRGNGIGNFVAINRFDELHEQQRDGSDVTIYPLELDGEPLGHFSGDMHHSYDCDLQLSLDQATVAPGGTMTLTMELVHNRPQTVSVPFVLWIENDAGQVMFQRSSPVRQYEWGERFDRSLPIRIPAVAPAGSYTVFVSVNEMRQGEAVRQIQFTIE